MDKRPLASPGAWDEALSFIDAAIGSHSGTPPIVSVKDTESSACADNQLSPTHSELCAKQAALATTELPELLGLQTTTRRGLDNVRPPPLQSPSSSALQIASEPLTTSLGQAMPQLSIQATTGAASPSSARSMESLGATLPNSLETKVLTEQKDTAIQADEDELRSLSVSLPWPLADSEPSVPEHGAANQIFPGLRQVHSTAQVPSKLQASRLQGLSERARQQQEEINSLRAHLADTAMNKFSRARPEVSKLAAPGFPVPARSVPATSAAIHSLSLSPSTIGANSSSLPSFSPVSSLEASRLQENELKLGQGGAQTQSHVHRTSWPPGNMPESWCGQSKPGHFPHQAAALSAKSGLAAMQAASARVGDLQARAEAFWAEQHHATQLLEGSLCQWLGYGGTKAAEEALQLSAQNSEAGSGTEQSIPHLAEGEADEAFWAKVLLWQEAEISRLLEDNARWRTHLKFQEAASNDPFAAASTLESRELRLLHEESAAQAELLERLLLLPSPAGSVRPAVSQELDVARAAENQLSPRLRARASSWAPESLQQARFRKSNLRSQPSFSRLSSPRSAGRSTSPTSPTSPDTHMNSPGENSDQSPKLSEPSTTGCPNADLRRSFLRNKLALRAPAALAELARRGPASVAASLHLDLRRLRLQGLARHSAAQEAVRRARTRQAAMKCSRLLQEKARLQSELQEESSPVPTPLTGLLTGLVDRRKTSPATQPLFTTSAGLHDVASTLASSERAILSARAARGAGPGGFSQAFKPPEREPCFDDYSLHRRSRPATDSNLLAHAPSGVTTFRMQRGR